MKLGAVPDREPSELVKGTPELPVPSGRDPVERLALRPVVVDESVKERLPPELVNGLPDDDIAPEPKPEVANAVPPLVSIDESGVDEAPEDGMTPDPNPEVSPLTPVENKVDDKSVGDSTDSVVDSVPEWLPWVLVKGLPDEGMAPDPKPEVPPLTPVDNRVNDIGTRDPED